MREVHFCNTCDFRLPYCVRTDRRFCGQQCRVWWYRHRGVKRHDFSPGAALSPRQAGRGKPKTLADALVALEASRAHADQLEASVRAQQAEERRLRNKLSEVSKELSATRAGLVAERDSLSEQLKTAKEERVQSEQRAETATAQAYELREQSSGLAERLKKVEDEAAAHKTVSERRGNDLAELRKTHEKLVEQHRKEADDLTAKVASGAASQEQLTRQNAELAKSRDELRDQLKSVERSAGENRTVLAWAQGRLAALEKERDQLHGQVKKAEDDAEEKRTALERTRADLSDRQKAHDQDTKRFVAEVRDLKAERDRLTEARDRLNQQNEDLVRRRDELRTRLETAESTLAQRDEDLSLQRRNFAAAERAHQEVHVVAESESRSLRAEKERRVAAEQRVEQLTRDLERVARESQVATSGDSQLVLAGMRDDVLAAELKEVRIHRDEAIAERELLAARILKLMAPGQYLEHAAAAGYDLTKDPLIRLKREEVLVEDRLAAWQESNKKRRRARRLDPEQTLDEQAYAAALSFRWRQIDHPHLRRKRQPKWVAVGFLLDQESERYLLALTLERISEMTKKMEQAD